MKNEEILIFNQLRMKIDIGKFNPLEHEKRIIFLSKGMIIAHENEIVFYDYKKYNKLFITSITEKNRRVKRMSKLLNDRFCIYCLDETLIYQFNKKDLTIKLLQKININLKSLFEVKENIFINFSNQYLYIWKKLKPIFKLKGMIYFFSYFLCSS